jgi:hypothetical protein
LTRSHYPSSRVTANSVHLFAQSTLGGLANLLFVRAEKGSFYHAQSDKGGGVKLILLVTIYLLAVSLTNCSHKRKDFETAKIAVAQELRLPGTAQFCTLDQAEFSTINSGRMVKLWVDNRNLAGVLVRTHFEVTIDPKSGLVKGATCLECAAEDEKQKLNEAMGELRALTPSPMSTQTPR